PRRALYLAIKARTPRTHWLAMLEKGAADLPRRIVQLWQGQEECVILDPRKRPPRSPRRGASVRMASCRRAIPGSVAKTVDFWGGSADSSFTCFRLDTFHVPFEPAIPKANIWSSGRTSILLQERTRPFPPRCW